MKNLFKCFAILFSLNLFAQSGNVSLEWSEQTITLDQVGAFTLPAVQNQKFTYLTDLGVIEVHIPIEELQSIQPNSIQFKNIQTRRINKKYNDLNGHSVTTEVQYDLVSGTSERGTKNYLNIIPFIKKGNEIHQITSLTFEYSVTPQSRNTSYSLSTTQSVLATGNWHKIKIGETGIYKLDKNFLTQIGVPSNVDPRTIKIHGHGGKMLPLLNSANLYFDNPETAIFVQGENDGSFDDNDYILFYGVGTKGWDPAHVTHNNLYSDDSYYYITYGGSYGKRVQNLVQPTGNASVQYTDANERVFHEIDAVNVAKLSRKWFGETFSNSFTNSYNLNLVNPVVSKTAVLSGNVAAASTSSSTMSVSLNGLVVANANLDGSGLNYIGTERYFEYEISSPQVNNTINIQFNNNGVPSARGYVDFVAIDYFKQLTGYGKQFGFRNSALTTLPSIGEFIITNASNLSQVWDVTDIVNPKILNNSSSQISLKVQGGSPKEFVALDLSDTFTPTYVGVVTNQNLKGTIFNEGPVDYLLITPSEFLTAANRLAQFHKNYNNFNVKVINVDAIYEEFSSGKQDIAAIRNFVRYVYHNSPDTSRKLKYLNLFGDTSFDFKNRIANNTNFIPIFHHLNTSLNATTQLAVRTNFNDQSSFATDDFFVLLDENEGNITSQSYVGMDVAVGRMIAQSVEEAENMVDKVIAYHQKENTGRWKVNGIALADDVDALGDINLQSTLNEQVDELVAEKPFFNIRKILMDAYKQEVTSAGPRYPKAKEEFYQALDAGALFVNFLGHGGEQGLTGERMMDVSDIAAINNEGRLPLFIIVTCEFTRFDNPEFLSGGERLLKKDKGGAIALLATSRKISISNAEVFSLLITNYLFDTNNVNVGAVTIAEALRLAKNTNPSEKGVVSYLGDPGLKLAIPKQDIVINKVNGIDIDAYDGHLRALDLVKLEGSVVNVNGGIINSYNGNLAIQVFDKNIDRQTLGNDGVRQNGVVHKMNFTTLGETVFRGNATVENGKFEIEFMVPKDIKLAIGEGKVSMYATKDGEAIDDFVGANTAIKIGGINNEAAEDNKAPEIKLYMNDESFIYGGITNASPLFLAVVEDENGINTASGIGHDMVAILDGDVNNPIVVNEFYETEANNFRKGYVKYPFKDLEPGVHNIVFKAWDSYNNMGTAEIQFVVTENESIELKNVLNYPNPFIDYTQFWFEHNRPQEPLQVQVQILSVAGRIVKTINQTIVSEGFNSRDITWDGKDDFGNKVGKGVYIYRLKVKSTITGQQVEKIEKLVIL